MRRDARGGLTSVVPEASRGETRSLLEELRRALAESRDGGEAALKLGPDDLRSLCSRAGVEGDAVAAFRSLVRSNLVRLRGRWREGPPARRPRVRRPRRGRGRVVARVRRRGPQRRGSGRRNAPVVPQREAAEDEQRDEGGRGAAGGQRRGALFQVGVTAAAASAIQEQTGRSTPLIEPALYAFGIWGLIFALSLAYAVYAALPSKRTDPVLRRVGWPTAAAFFGIGMWSVFVPAGQLLLALAMLSLAFALLLVAYLRLARSDRSALSAAERWIVAPTVGIYLGWLTAANVVSVDSEAVRFGLVEGGGTGEALLGSVLLLAGSALAAAIAAAGKSGPAQGYGAYAATVLWALVGVVVGQYDASFLTTVAATVSIVVVALVVLGAPGGGRPSPVGTARSGAV
ncbi:hypothetical protein GBA65_01415 [Rubrobacter marinus]|uniref:Uncharacterized protein n=1 Tax=Rubrobacter marinus TaxID=2653852 RepID=A0A6G8PT60_9ACTN|nr:hypothetical protein [Rubrobacter marinus]QIN77387.1 hypothetical protein GBA65_01415 [Rubrobacter marinus]